MFCTVSKIDMYEIAIYTDLFLLNVSKIHEMCLYDEIFNISFQY